MIDRITIRNFRSIGEVTVDLSPVTVLIGRSRTGKSNFPARHPLPAGVPA